LYSAKESEKNALEMGAGCQNRLTESSTGLINEISMNRVLEIAECEELRNSVFFCPEIRKARE